MPRKASASKKQPPKRESGRRKPNVGSESSSAAEESDNESDDNRPSTSTQAKTRLNKSKVLNTSTAPGITVDITALTTNTVKYLLNFSATKIPITQSTIVRSVNIPASKIAEVFEASAIILKDVYGLEMSRVGSEKSNKTFIIYSSFNSAVTAIQLPPDNRHEVSLLFLILSYIFMKGGEVLEVNLIQFLNQLEIDVNEPHKIFGDVRKLLREKFSRTRYLKRTDIEIEGVNDKQTHLSWGERAEKEFDKKEVLKAVGKIMNKSPATFINQFHATQGNEEVEDMIID